MNKSYADYLKELPSRVGQIDIDVTGSISKYPWKGTFTCKVPTLRDYILADQKRAALNGGVPDEELDRSIAQTTQMLAYLSVVLEETPKWWREDLKNGSDCLDVNLIVILHDKVKTFENEWKEKVWGSNEPKPEEDGKKSE